MGRTQENQSDGRPGSHLRDQAGRVFLFTLLALLLNGYSFGSADHAIHLIFVEELIQPGRYADMLVAQAIPHHPTIVWWIEATLAKTLGLHQALFALHVLTLASTALASERLVRALGGGGQAANLVLLLMAPAHFALAGVDSLDPLFLPRGAALPFQLFALAFLLEGRLRWSFGLLGLAACIHAPSAAAMTIAAITCVLASRESDRRAPLMLAPGLLVATVIWLRGLLERSWEASSILVDEAWYAIIDARLSAHLNPSSWAIMEWLQGIAQLLLLLLFVFSPALVESRRRLLYLVGGLVAWATLGGSGLGSGARLALALQLEPWEGLRFVPWMLGACAAVFIARASQNLPRAAQGAILIATLASSYAVSAVDRDKLGEIHLQTAPSADASFALGVGETLVKEGVAKKARVLWPPAHLVEERRLAGVAGSVSWKDGGEALFDRQLALDWVNELTLVCGVNPIDREFPRPSTERYGQLKLLRNNIDYHWSRRTPKQLLHASRDLGATHFVMRGDPPPSDRTEPPSSTLKLPNLAEAQMPESSSSSSPTRDEPQAIPALFEQGGWRLISVEDAALVLYPPVELPAAPTAEEPSEVEEP